MAYVVSPRRQAGEEEGAQRGRRKHAGVRKDSSRAPGFLKGRQGVKSRAGLMRIDGTAQTRGVSMGRFTDASSATPRDILQDHYGGCRVQATKRYAVTLCQWQQRGFKTRNGPSFEEPGAS
jgi:hypothetical protein